MDIRLKLLSFTVTGFFVALVLLLLRNRKLKESLSIVWLIFAVVIIATTFFFGLVEKLARLLNIRDPNNLLFLMAIVFIISACIIISVEISHFSCQIKNLTQEFALFRNEMVGKGKKGDSKTSNYS